MAPRRALIAGLEGFLILFAVALSHRLFAFSSLAPQLPLASVDGLKVLGVGLLSDLWISYLGGALLVAISLVAAVLGDDWMSRFACAFLLIGLALATAAHQVFVESHVPLTVAAVLDSSAKPVALHWLNGWAAAILAVFAVVTLLVLRADWFGRRDFRGLVGAALVLTALAFASHNRNITWRQEPSVPEPLRVNFIEQIYEDAVSING